MSRIYIIITSLLAITWFLSPFGEVKAGDERIDERETMVREQMMERGIKDPVTLVALRHVPRHDFVPDELSHSAYDDRPLPIGYGQTISQPYIVAYMTEIIHPGSEKKILEIGTGSGYQAAVLAATGAEVYSIEIVSELAQSARQRLQRLGYRNVSVRNTDGYYGWPEVAPFDAIIVTAAAEFVPPPLLKQLAEGGLMVIPIGSPFFVQTLMLVQRQGEDIVSTNLMPVRFVPFRRQE